MSAKSFAGVHPALHLDITALPTLGVNIYLDELMGDPTFEPSEAHEAAAHAVNGLQSLESGMGMGRLFAVSVSRGPFQLRYMQDGEGVVYSRSDEYMTPQHVQAIPPSVGLNLYLAQRGIVSSYASTDGTRAVLPAGETSEGRSALINTAKGSVGRTVTQAVVEMLGVTVEGGWHTNTAGLFYQPCILSGESAPIQTTDQMCNPCIRNVAIAMVALGESAPAPYMPKH